MRLGKTQHQILKVMYDFENSGGYQFGRQLETGKGKLRKELMKTREVVEKITGLKYPKEKDYGIDWDWKMNRLSIALSTSKFPKVDKKWKEIQRRRSEWKKLSTSVYRSIKLLEMNRLVEKGRFGRRENSCSNFIHLTEKGRRIVSHKK